jgi:hypothetical protein
LKKAFLFPFLSVFLVSFESIFPAGHWQVSLIASNSLAGIMGVEPNGTYLSFLA